jgi:uncharacterized SAM-binding protein YcdF (DUF218 family)
MIYLAKILPVFVLPTGLVILLVLASLVFRKRVFAVAGLLILWLSSTPVVGNLAMRAAEGWQARTPVASMPQARAIVVLTGMLRQAPGDEHLDEWAEGVDRFEAGVALLKAGKAPMLIFPGGWVPWWPDAQPEGKVLAERAVALGVPRDQIVVTGKASNTADEAREVATVLRRLGPDAHSDAVILVTSAFHMRRSRLIFASAGVTVVPFAVDFQVSEAPFTMFGLLPRADSIEKTETALRELYGYLFYRLGTNTPAKAPTMSP